MGKYLKDRELDSVLENYFNEGLLSKFEKWQQKKAEEIEQKQKEKQSKDDAKSLGLTPDQYKQYINYKEDSEDRKYISNMCNKLVPIIKKIFNQLKNTKEFKDKCIKSSENYNNQWLHDGHDGEAPLKSNYIPKINIQYYGDYIEIINDSQEINIVYGWILDDIIKILKSEYKDIKLDYNTGDGDEGCIYTELSKEYKLNKIKSQFANE